MKPLSFLRSATLVVALAAVAAAQDESPEPPLADVVGPLVMDLGADSEAARDAARKRLMELAGPTMIEGERVLDALPEPIDSMPPAVREALASVRRAIADRLAELAVNETRLSIDVVQEPLSAVLKEIEQKTGNRILDVREQFGQEAADRPITLRVDEAPFWEVVDQVLDEAGLGVYAYSGEQALALVAREPGATPRWAIATYAGPLRIEPIRINAVRNLRQVSSESLNLQLEIAWEPRLSPIAFSQPLSELTAANENGTTLSMARPEGSIDMEVSGGGQATEIQLPLLLPTRDTKLIASLKGTLTAVLPGRTAEFRFDKLDAVESTVTKQVGGATVSVTSMRKNNEIWELHMRLKIDVDDPTGDGPFASHRGWVFENESFLEDPNGQPVEHSGYETTMQRGNEIGVAYLFYLPEGPAGHTWVYKTPTAILRQPIEYELNHIPLP